MPPPQFDPFGNRRFAQIEADVSAINTKLATIAAGVASINAKLGPLLAAVNAPAWLTPAPIATPASPEAVTVVVTYSPVIDVGGQIYSLLDQIIAGEKIIEGLFPPPSSAKHIKLELPSLTRKGKPVPNYELPNDEVVTITIKTTNSAGMTEPVPTGDVFTAVSSNPASLNAVIGTDASGNPALVVNALVQASPNISVTVSDSAGLAQDVQIFDIVADVTPTNVVLDLADATHAPQAVPTAPGP